MHAFARRWQVSVLLTELHDRLRDAVRVKEGRKIDPTAAIVDARSLRAAASVPCTTSGWDAGKKVGGRKRHLAVDALGLLLLVVLVTAASVQDRNADVPLLSRLLERLVQLALARCLGHLAPDMPGVVAAVLLDDGHEPGADGPVSMGPEAVEKVGLVERSSGRRQFRRLNRGGDRQANAALHRIVFTRLRVDPRTQDYYERRIKEARRGAKSSAASIATRPGGLPPGKTATASPPLIGAVVTDERLRRVSETPPNTLQYRFDGPEEAPVLILGPSLGTTWHMSWKPSLGVHAVRNDTVCAGRFPH
nr:transposase [Streptomyces qaidamensis]